MSELSVEAEMLADILDELADDLGEHGNGALHRRSARMIRRLLGRPGGMFSFTPTAPTPPA